MHIRKYGWLIGAISGVLLVLLLWPVFSFLRISPLTAVALAIATGVLSPVNYYYETLRKLRKQTGLPWEEQRATLSDEAMVITYESGFEVKAPWAKIRRIREVPEGLLLDLEGSGLLFLPGRALNPEARAFLSAKVRG